MCSARVIHGKTIWICDLDRKNKANHVSKFFVFKSWVYDKTAEVNKIHKKRKKMNEWNEKILH